MKNLCILLIALLMASGASAQFGSTCLPEGITFTTQAQIDSFQVNYPGCTGIEGDVTINAPSSITNLNGLNVLTSIGGDFNIIWTNGLTIPTGLDNLTSIGGSIEIYENASLTSLTGLGDLTSIGGDLSINSNSSLTSLTGLDNLTSIGGDLYIEGNYSLSTCDAQGLCDYLANPNGKISIYYNATGCNSVIDIAMACGGSIPCLPFGDYNFVSQADIDNYQMAFPNCTTLQGNVSISGGDITNLSGLEGLISIGGDLNIGNESMTNLMGLEGLTSIGGDLNIEGNDTITNLMGLEGLTSIGGDLHVRSNTALNSLTGIEGLMSIGGSLVIIGNDSLIDLTGLENLASIAGNIDIGKLYAPYPIGNDKLTSLTGLENLTSLGGDLSIISNEGLLDLTGLEGLTTVEGGLNLFFNPKLTNLTGLDNLISINSHLYIVLNNGLKSLTGLGNLTIRGGLAIEANNSLYNLTGLNNLDSIINGLSIRYNDSLTNLSGLNSLIFLPSISIANNPALTSLTGMEALSSLQWISIENNPALTSLVGLDSINGDSVTYLSIHDNISLSTCDAQWLCNYLADPNGSISIYNNATGCNSVIDLAIACGGAPCLPYGDYYFVSQADIDNFQTAFPNCTELLGNVLIFGSDITNLSGLDNVTSIGGNLSISNNDSLSSLTGLDNLTSIGGHLHIYDNNALTSLTGLDNIDAASIIELYVVYNTSLSSCAAQSICDYLASPNSVVDIHDNATGCNSQEEVEAACGVGVEESAVGGQRSAVSIFPNPSATTITIELLESTAIHNEPMFTIYNIHGQQLIKRQITEQQTVVDVSGFSQGVYLVKVTDERKVQVGKFVKQ